MPQMDSRLQVLLAAAVAAVLAVSATISVCDIDLADLGLGSEAACMQAFDEIHLERKFLELSEDMLKVRPRQLKAHEQNMHRISIRILRITVQRTLT